VHATLHRHFFQPRNASDRRHSKSCRRKCCSTFTWKGLSQLVSLHAVSPKSSLGPHGPTHNRCSAQLRHRFRRFPYGPMHLLGGVCEDNRTVYESYFTPADSWRSPCTRNRVLTQPQNQQNKANDRLNTEASQNSCDGLPTALRRKTRQLCQNGLRSFHNGSSPDESLLFARRVSNSHRAQPYPHSAQYIHHRDGRVVAEIIISASISRWTLRRSPLRTVVRAKIGLLLCAEAGMPASAERHLHHRRVAEQLHGAAAGARAFCMRNGIGQYKSGESARCAPPGISAGVAHHRRTNPLPIIGLGPAAVVARRSREQFA